MIVMVKATRYFVDEDGTEVAWSATVSGAGDKMGGWFEKFLAIPTAALDLPEIGGG